MLRKLGQYQKINGYPICREGKNLLNGIYKTKNGLMK